MVPSYLFPRPDPALKLYGGRFLARGGRSNQVEGKGRRRNVILEFESYKNALEYYYSPEYQAAVKIRLECGECDMVGPIPEGDGGDVR